VMLEVGPGVLSFRRNANRTANTNDTPNYTLSISKRGI
jgi:hypothetical protein